MNLRRIPVFLVSMLAMQMSAIAQSFVTRQCAMKPYSNPKGLNQELDNATYEKGWRLLTWDTANPGYTISDTLPFAWNVNGNVQKVFRGVSNGSVTFTTNPLPSKVVSFIQTSSLPDPQLAEKSIGFFGLLAKGENDQVFVKSFGTAPNRQYWVKFHSFSIPDDSASGYSVYGNYALVFEEKNNEVHFVQMTQGNTTGILSANQKRATLTMGSNWGPFDGIAIADKYDNNTAVNYVPSTLNNGVGDNRYFTLMPFNNSTNWNDAAFLRAELIPGSGYIKENSDFGISFSFASQGLSNPKSLKLSLKIGNLPTQSFNLDTFTQSDSFGVYRGILTVSSTGLTLGVPHPASAWLENAITGESDPTNDSLLKFADLVIQSQQIQSTGYPVLEVFTGNWDHRSALLDVQLENLTKTHPILQNAIVLNHHVLDPMATDLSSLLPVLTAGIEMGKFPALTLNRGLYETKADNSVFESDSLASKLDKYQVLNTPVVAKVENLKYDPITRKVTGSYVISALDYVDPSSLKVTVMLREKTQRGNTSGWLQRMSLEETKRSGSVFFGKSTKMVGYTYPNVAFDWSSEGNGLTGKELGVKGISTPGTNYNGLINFTLPDSIVKVTFPKTVDFADSGDAFLRYKPADLEVVVIVTDDRLKSNLKKAETNAAAPIVAATVQPVWDVKASTEKWVKPILHVYPNPSTNHVWLISNRDIVALEVFDVRGQTQPMNLRSDSPREFYLNADSLVPGLYFIQAIDTQNQRQTIRFIKGL